MCNKFFHPYCGRHTLQQRKKTEQIFLDESSSADAAAQVARSKIWTSSSGPAYAISKHSEIHFNYHRRYGRYGR